MKHARTWSLADAQHLYRRAGFGATRAELEASLREGREGTLERIFARRTHDAHLHAGIERLLGVERIESLQAWWMALVLANRAPLVERVTLLGDRPV